VENFGTSTAAVIDELRHFSGVALDTKNLLMNSARAALAKNKRERGEADLLRNKKVRSHSATPPAEFSSASELFISSAEPSRSSSGLQN
jgi:hypothetical protein